MNKRERLPFLMAFESNPMLTYDESEDLNFDDEDEDVSTETFCDIEWNQGEIMQNYPCVIHDGKQYFVRALDDSMGKCVVSVSLFEDSMNLRKHFNSVYEVLEFLDLNDNENPLSVVIVDNDMNVLKDITAEQYSIRVA